MKKNRGAKIMALIALFAIIISIIGTGVLIIIETVYGPTQTTELTQEQIDEIMEQLSQSGATSSGETLDLSGITLDLSGETLDLSGETIDLGEETQTDIEE